MNSNDIIQGFIDLVLREKRQNKVFPNIYIGSWECDILELTKSGYLYEYEVKVSRADFKNDIKKVSYGNSKYDIIKAGSRVNYFFYVVPENLINIDEVPEFAGLIYAKKLSFSTGSLFNNKVVERVYFETVKQAPKLSKEKITDQKLMKLLESIYYRFHTYRLKLKSA